MSLSERAALLLKRRVVLDALLKGYISYSATPPYDQKLEAFLARLKAGDELSAVQS
jgi:hypothetical protein